MDSKRFQKLALVAAAGALGVALITLMSGEPAERESRAPADRNLAPEQLPPRMTDTDPPAGDLGGVSDPSRILGASEQTLIQRADPETGELKQEFWGSLEPRADGVFDIAEPQARLYLAPWRVIHMRGDRGRFVAPDNHLQSGEFHDDLVITVYEAPRDRPADLAADSADRAVEVRLDHAAFDTTLGEVRSEGDVDLRTPVTGQVHFRGRGLTLVYNDLRNRIDHLEIEHGESLRYDPGAGDGRDAGEADAARTRDARAGSPPDDPERAERSGGPLQYYRVAFEQDVRVTSGDWTVEAERLTVFVTLDGDAAEGRDGVASGGPAEVERRVARRVAELMPLLIGRLGDADAGAAIEEEAAPARASSSAGVDREAVLTWSGRLLMTPLEELPEELAASAAEDRRDLYVRFEGEPIVVRSSGDGDRLACRTIEYLESTRRITARGSAAHPLRIDSAALGTVTAESLTHRLDSGAATLHGAGAIEAADPGNGEAGEASRVLPPDFRLTWTEGVDLSLAAGAEGEGPTGIESATFRGDVRIHDDRFTLRADTLTPRFAAADPEAGGEGERRLEAIEASGGVRVEVEEGWIAANRLLVTSAASGGGRFAPTGIVAEGDARLADPTQRLDARLIEVAVAERDRPADDQAEEADEPDRSLAGQVGVEITSFTARDDVRLALANGAEVRGDRLDADPRDRAATLTGSPVLITRAPDDDAAVPETELEVLQLRIEDNGEVAWSDGPGRFTYTQAATDRDAGPAGRRVAVTWRDRMRFDKQLDTIQVFGQVVTEAEDSPREVNRLTGDELTLELSAAAEPSGARAPDERSGAGRGGQVSLDASMDRRRLKRATARGDAVLRATRWREDDRREVLTRFRLSGPVLRFRNEEGGAEVVGPGDMLIEDYRDPPAEGQDGGAAGAGDGAAASRFTGRGATVFTFNRHLRWDDAERTVTLAGSVWMTHEAPGREGPLELQAEQLVARLTDGAEPIDAVGMTGVEVRIGRIEATGGVQVRDGTRRVSADRLEYDAADQTVLLTASPGGRVTVADTDQPRPLRASAIRWDLRTNELEIVDADL